MRSTFRFWSAVFTLVLSRMLVPVHSSRTGLVNLGMVLLLAASQGINGGGVAVAHADAALQSGDLLVGAGIQSLGFGNYSGGVVRIRGGAKTTFCESTVDGYALDFFVAPTDVLVDSVGRVVFLAPLSGFANNYSGHTMGLFRCSMLGQPPEKLAIFLLDPSEANLAASAGFAVPFPNQAFLDIQGLHLKRVKSINVNKALAGQVTISGDDVYVMGGNSAGSFQQIDYYVAADHWEQHDFSTANLPNLPSMVNHGGTTYTVAYNIIAADTEPLELKVSGEVFGTHFSLDLGLFGGHHEVRGILADNLAEGHVVSSCPPLPPYSLIEPFYGPFTGRPLAGLGVVAYDENGGLGLVVTSNYAPLTVYLAKIDQALLNGDEQDDVSAYFLNDSGSCAATPSLKFEPVVPFFDKLAHGNGSDRLAAATVGLVGTQRLYGRVIRVANADDGTDSVPVLAEGLVAPIGIAGYPSQVSDAGGLVLVWQIDSPVDVLVTDASGRRIGVDATTHQPINDFGPNGFVGPPGEPRIFAVRSPQPGAFQVDAVGTAAGPYAFHVYGADLSQTAGHSVDTNGMASVGSTGRLDFTLGSDATLSFMNQRDMAVTKINAPKTVTLTTEKPAVTSHIKVTIQNRAVHDEIVPDMATLQTLVTLELVSLGPCSAPAATLHQGSPQVKLPLTLKSKKTANVVFDATFACANDPIKSTASSFHGDYQVQARIDHAALDGNADGHPDDDVCPRSVTPPFAIDPNPDGTIKDRGCGAKKGDGTNGDPIVVDVVVK